MTIVLNDRRARYVASASQTSFDVDFPIDTDADVAVDHKVDATGIITRLTLTTDYTVTLDGAAPNTADVDLVTGAAVNDIITIEGQTSPARDTDFTTGGDYFAGTVNNAEDRQYRIDQERLRDRDRTVVANPVSPDTFDPTLPDTVGEASKFLRLNSGETDLEFAEFTTIGTAVLSDAVPADPTATGASGSSDDISRADHAHPLPGQGTGLTTSGDDLAVDVGTAANKIVQLDGSALLPAVDGSALTNVLPTTHIGGLVTSPGTDGDHDVDITKGKCRNAADTVDMVLAAALTKQIDASWVTGDDQGGLSSSLTVANDTLYFVHAITVGGTVDIGFDTSETAANFVTDHSATAYRAIGYVVTDGSANILPFEQSGDVFWMQEGIEDVDDNTITNNAFETATLSIPPNSLGYFTFNLTNAGETATIGVIYIRTSASSTGVGNVNMAANIQMGGTTFDQMASHGTFKVDGSSQFSYAAAEAAGTAIVKIYTLGCFMTTRSEP